MVLLDMTIPAHSQTVIVGRRMRGCKVLLTSAYSREMADRRQTRTEGDLFANRFGSATW